MESEWIEVDPILWTENPVNFVSIAARLMVCCG